MGQLAKLEELVSEGNYGPIRLIVVQPTPFCNIDCVYCYLPNRNDRRRMDMAVVEAIGRRAVAHPLATPETTMVWHGGEPTAVPVTWYEEAFSRLARYSASGQVAHSFQTNGIAIDSAWIDLWRRWNVRIGISIDGPRDLNDMRRRTRAGNGSFDLALRGLHRLREAGLPFHVISVLTLDALNRPDDLIDFYLAEGVRDICFNVEEEEGPHRRSSLAADGAVGAYGRFLRRIAERVREAGGALRCREIDGVASLIAAPPEVRRHNGQVRPLEIVSIAVDGAMSTYSPELLGTSSKEFADFSFGNILAEGPEAMLENPAFRRLRADVEAGVAACQASCGYFGVCGGGAPANKYFEHGHCKGTETLYCRLTRKTPINVLLPVFEDHAAIG